MADPKRRPSLIAVDENYTPPENATPGDVLKGQFAQVKRDAIAEGIKRQKARQDAETELQIKGVKNAHLDELARVAARERAIGHHRAGWIFGLIGALIGGVGTFFVIDAGQKAAFDAANRAAAQATTNGYMLRTVDDAREPPDAQRGADR